MIRRVVAVAFVFALPGLSVLAQQYRVEKDLLGEKQVPADAYYGVQTARALENFQISGIKTNHYPGYFEAWAIVKLGPERGSASAPVPQRPQRSPPAVTSRAASGNG